MGRRICFDLLVIDDDSSILGMTRMLGRQTFVRNAVVLQRACTIVLLIVIKVGGRQVHHLLAVRSRLSCYHLALLDISTAIILS